MLSCYVLIVKKIPPVVMFDLGTFVIHRWAAVHKMPRLMSKERDPHDVLLDGVHE